MIGFCIRPFMKYPFALLAVTLCLNSTAATFSVSPNSVSNDYAGLITFQMTGLPAGETVQVVQYYDFNGDGIVNGPDAPVRGELITEGQLGLLGGATNISVMRDEDGLTNGVIKSSFRFALAPDVSTGVGKYIFRISSPSNDFTAVSVPFAVVSAAYAQKVIGSVMSNGTNVPNAGVALVQVVSGPSIKVIVGTAADSAGNYVLKAPSGSYKMLAFWPGFVADFNTAPTVALAPGATITTNLSLIAGTTTLSGKLVDYNNPSLPSLPYSQIMVIGTNYQFVIAMTDSNANFNVPITPGVWTVRARWKSAVAKSYLIPDPLPIEDEAHFNTLAGAVNNANITLKHATALVYGTVEDNHSNGSPGINLSASGDGGQFDGIALSDSNGLYSLAMDAGGGFIEVPNLSDPPANAYLWTGTYFSVNNSQAMNLNVTGYVATAHMRWHIMNETGGGFSNLSCFANNSVASTFGNADATGLLDLPVFAGVWSLHIGAVFTNLIFPDVPSVTITNGVDFAGTIIARTVTGQVSGYLHGPGSIVIANFPITATNSFGTTNYTLSSRTDTAGNYAIPVCNGTWNVGLGGYLGGYLPISPTNVTVPPSNAIANFIAAPIPPPQITTTSFPDATVSNFYDIPLAVTNGSGVLIWSVVGGALPGGLNVQFFGIETDILGAPTNTGLFSFTLKVTDSRGSNDVRALSINVIQPPQPMQITTPYSLGPALGCPYTNQFQATGGTPPYTWALASSSSPLPDGLNFDTNGLLSGTPQVMSYFSPTVKAIDSQGLSTNEMLSISINSPLSVYPGVLPYGEVQTPYYGYPPVSGAVQSWTIVSNSLPPGLSLNPAQGFISGTPTNAGIYPFTLEVKDGCTTADLILSITNVPALQIITTTLPTAPLNSPYSAQLQHSGGAPPFYWYTYDLLPDGLVLNSDGSITGIPDVQATANFTAQVYDSAGGATTRTLTITASGQPMLDLPAHGGPQQFTFRITGVSNQSYTVQFATKLTNWVDLLTTNAPAAVFSITDPQATNTSRFYKLKVNP